MIFFHYEELPDELFIMAQNTPESTENTENTGPEPQLLDEEDKQKVQRGLVEFFRDGYIKNVSNGEPASDETILNYINSILVTYGVKISGGFILKNMGMFRGNTGSSSIDIDIYLPYVHAKNIQTKKETTATIHKLLQQLFDVDIVNGHPKYKYFKVTRVKSNRANFFTKNGIYAVTKYSKGSNAEMDLVQADKRSTPIEIIQRFDLSFCQNWYDGENLWSMDREAVYKRDSGFLEDAYIPLYLDKNPVTRKRILKYMKRGFHVQYREPRTDNLVKITLDDLKNVNT